jgi:hypothetical protein
MPFFDDMTDAVEAYPETYVDLEIIDVSIPGDVLNVEEVGFFKVRITNRGPLHLTGVTLRVSGQNGATVRAGLGMPFVSSFISAELPTVDAHGGSQELSLPAFTAPADAQDSKTLVKATLEDWDADLNHILIGHSDPHRDAPKGTYAAAVAAS